MIIDLEKMRSVNFAHGILGGRVGGGKSPLNRFAAGDAFTPADLTTGFLWFDADDASTIHEDDAAGRVSKWDDKFADSNNLIMATAANQPSLLTADQNGRNAVWTNTSNSAYMQTVALIGGIEAQPFTIIHAGRHPTVSNQRIYDGIDSTNRVLLMDQSSNFSVFAGTLVGTGVARENVYRIIAIIWDGASSSLRIDGVEQWSPGTNPGTKSLGGFTIGAQWDATNHGSNVFGEIIAFGGRDSTDISNVESFLAARWQ